MEKKGFIPSLVTQETAFIKKKMHQAMRKSVLPDCAAPGNISPGFFSQNRNHVNKDTKWRTALQSRDFLAGCMDVPQFCKFSE